MLLKAECIGVLQSAVLRAGQKRRPSSLRQDNAQCTLYKKLDPARVTTAGIALSVAQPMDSHLCFARSSSLSRLNLNAE
jgi:hypothetical protein